MSTFLKFTSTKVIVFVVLLLLLFVIAWILPAFIPVGPGCQNCGPNAYAQTRSVLLWILAPILMLTNGQQSTLILLIFLAIEIIYLYLIDCLICYLFCRKKYE